MEPPEDRIGLQKRAMYMIIIIVSLTLCYSSSLASPVVTTSRTPATVSPKRIISVLLILSFKRKKARITVITGLMLLTMAMMVRGRYFVVE